MKKKIKQKGLAVKKSNKRAVIKSLECWGCQNKKGREMTAIKFSFPLILEKPFVIKVHSFSY